MSREGAMITKLKEGLQEALVFLRQLGDFKIPAVMERRRKGLLDKLVDLQGDTFRGAEGATHHDKPTTEDKPQAPPPEAATEKLKSPEPPVVIREKAEDKSPRDSVTSPTGGSPTKRLSRGDSKISTLVGNYEHITIVAKKEEVAETPKRFVQLKKVAKPTDFPDPDRGKEKDDKEEEDSAANDEEPSSQPNGKEKVNGSLKPERPASMVSEESVNVEPEEEEGEEEIEESVEKESGKKKAKFGRFKIGKLGDKLKKKNKGGRDKSPSRAMEDEDEKSGGSEAEEVDNKEGSSTPPELEEGVKIAGMLERKVTSRFKSKWVKVSVKLKDNVLYVGDKETIALSGFLVSATDVGFDIVNHSTKKQLQFKTDREENSKESWVEAINTAIQESTPEQEEPPAEETSTAESATKSEDLPSITVEEPVEEEPLTNTLKKKRDSKALAVNKPARKLPDQGVEMKGYIHRKKPGLGTRWDKTYCVLTYQAIYFTTMQDNNEYNHMLPLTGDTNEKRTISEKKGHDKNSKGINIKLGKKTEQLSVESSEFDQWQSALERVLGIGGVEELLSEDEENLIEEDDGELYEELEAEDFPPPIPSSPRPQHNPLQVPDDIIIDEDIYEDTDDYRQDFEESPVHKAAPPALPDRNPVKKDASPPPPLPSRNAPPPPKSVGPTLPPRGAKEEPRQYETSKPLAKKPAAAPPPPPDVGGEEIYDDVIPGGGGDDQDAEIEETYDDVLVGETDEMEETYDDVVSATTSTTGGKPKASEPEPITEEFYEDMVPGAGDGPQEDYVLMEPGEDVGGEELYVDVDAPPPVRTIAQPKPAADQLSSSPRTPKSGTFSRMFKGKPSSPLPERKGHSGAIHHKAPKKSKFEERWAVIDGNFLIISKNQTAKSHQEKLPLSECGLDMGSPDVGPGEHAFRITTKGDRVHHFKLKSRPDFDRWVTIVKGLTKYAPIETVSRGEQEVYEAKEDHIGENAGELTFKKGTYIRLISKDGDEWVGQIGNEAHVFEGKIGKFPMSKVSLAEDLYI